MSSGQRVSTPERGGIRTDALSRAPLRMRPDRTLVPTAVTDFLRENARVPRRAAAQKVDLRQWTTMPRGGHLAAIEQPELLVEDTRTFFRGLREPQAGRAR
jgi:hypothetical protein